MKKFQNKSKVFRHSSDIGETQGPPCKHITSYFPGFQVISVIRLSGLPAEKANRRIWRMKSIAQCGGQLLCISYHLICHGISLSIPFRRKPVLPPCCTVKTTGLAGGLHCPYKGLLPACAPEGALRVCQLHHIYSRGCREIGDIKENEDFRRFNYRSAEKVYKEFMLYAIGRNIMKYH